MFPRALPSHKLLNMNSCYLYTTNYDSYGNLYIYAGAYVFKDIDNATHDGGEAWSVVWTSRGFVRYGFDLFDTAKPLAYH